jgi:site-specific DNA-cytosine methylase
MRVCVSRRSSLRMLAFGDRQMAYVTRQTIAIESELSFGLIEVRRLSPRAFIIENVKGLSRDSSRTIFTVRGSARPQTFLTPTNFVAPRSEAMGQLGNTVPVLLAHTIGARVARKHTEQDTLALAEQVRAA